MNAPQFSCMHIAAVNLIEDHKAGKPVNKVRLSAAYALMADYDSAVARARVLKGAA